MKHFFGTAVFIETVRIRHENLSCRCLTTKCMQIPASVITNDPRLKLFSNQRESEKEIQFQPSAFHRSSRKANQESGFEKKKFFPRRRLSSSQNKNRTEKFDISEVVEVLNGFKELLYEEKEQRKKEKEQREKEFICIKELLCKIIKNDEEDDNRRPHKKKIKCNC